MSEEHFPDDTVFLGDCFTWAQESYDTFAADGEKLEGWGKQPYWLDRFIRAAKQNVELFGLRYGAEHKPGGLGALDVTERLHGSHPDLVTAQTLVRTLDAMNFRYVAEVKEGARRLVRMLPGSVEKVDFLRNALAPMKSGKPLCGPPSTWLMENESGYWKSCVAPKLEDKVPRATRRTVLSFPAHKSKAGGMSDLFEVPPVQMGTSGAPTFSVTNGAPNSPHAVKYPDGRPLREEEIKAARSHKPRNPNGDLLCWCYSTHDGCKSEAGKCFRGEHELTKLKGLHPVILMHLERRCGHRSNTKVAIEDIDRRAQSLRHQLAADDLEKRVETDVKGAAGGCATPITPSTKEDIHPIETLSQAGCVDAETNSLPTPPVDASVSGILEEENANATDPPSHVAPAHSDQENCLSDSTIQPHRFWEDFHLLLVFQEINFATPEESTRKLGVLSDQWTGGQLGDRLRASWIARYLRCNNLWKNGGRNYIRRCTSTCGSI